MSQLIKVAAWTGELRASVVFVHGLGGHAYNTWRRGSDDQSFWPLWLAQDVDGIAVYTLSYPAPLSNWLGTAMPLQDRAVSVLECMLGEPSFRTKPVTFICHSLGGLLVKQLMLDLQQQQERRPEAAELLEQVRQVIFIATPHTGSRQATLLDRARFLAWPTAIARSLVANDPSLRQINVSYRGLADDRRHKLRHRIFYETQDTPAGIVVDEASSDPGLPGDPPIPIDANHITIAKPIDRFTLLYLRTRDFISDYPERQPRPTAFLPCELPTIRTEHSWNVVPKLLRIAAIVLVATIAFKGMQTLIHLESKIDRLIVLTSQEKGVEIPVLRNILAKMGETGIPDKDIPKRLAEKADEVVSLRREIAQVRGVRPELASSARQAETLIEKGDVDQAAIALDASRGQIRANQLIEEGDPKQALDVLRQALRRLDSVSMEPSTDVHLVRGYIYKDLAQASSETGDNISADNYQELALKEFESIKEDAQLKVEHPGEFAGAMNGIGNIYHLRAQYRKAIEYYQRATSLVPDYAYAWHDMFLAYFDLAKQGDVDLKAMRQALDMTKKTGAGWPGLDANHIAELQKMLAQIEQASRRQATPSGTRRPQSKPGG